MLITRRSPFTGKVRHWEINVTPFQISRWESGVNIQSAMPQLTDDEREFIKTGIHPDEWDSMLGGEE